MSNDNNIRNFTATDIEKYHKGQLSAKEMHALEKAALDDPFLSDALEGYAMAGVDVDGDTAELKKRIAQKTQDAKVIRMPSNIRTASPWLRIAVMIVVLAGAGMLAYQVFKPSVRDGVIVQKLPDEDKGQTVDQVNTQSQPGKNDSPSVNISPNSNLEEQANEKPEALVERSRYKELNGEIKSTSTDSVSANLGLTEKLPVTSAPSKSEIITADENRKKITDDNSKDKNAIVTRDNTKNKEASPKTNNAESNKLQEVTVNAQGANNRGKQVYRNSNVFRGQVTDANNNAMPFANIINTTDNVGTFSDAKGNFTLVSPYDSVMDVQVRALGFENSRQRLRNDVSINQVVLQEDRSMTARILDTAKRNYAIRSRDGNMSFEEPEPADGWKSYDSYLANNLHDIPEADDVKKNTGSDAVELSFEVNKYGDPVNIKVEKSLCDKCDKEAIRLVKEGPKWKRKAKKGKRTTVTIPFIKPD